MSVIEVMSIVKQQTAEVGIIIMLGLIDAFIDAFFGSSSNGSERGDEES